MKLFNTFSISLIVLTMSVASVSAQSGGTQSLETATVVSQQLEKIVSIPGDLTPYQSVNIHAKVTGFLESIPVDRGSWVKQGDVLAVLSAPELRAQRLEAEAKIQRIESQRAEAESKVAALQATLASSQSTYDRLKAASQTPGVVAGNDLEVAMRTLDVQRLNAEAQKSSVEALLKEKAVAEAAVGVVKEMQEYLRVTAPFEGVITERNVHPGSLVGPSGAVMLKIEQVSRLRLTVPVPEIYVGTITKGTKVSFRVSAFPNETFQGVIARPAYSLDMKTRSMSVELDVNNPRLRLAPGMFAEVQWPVSRQQSSLFVPTSAVVRTSERQFVVRVREGVAEWVDVRRGEVNGALIEIFGDLRLGDVVVRRGNDEIRPGTPLTSSVAKP
ncbi:MAG: efflux RND transporter periplasmic adaptor subunit [Acidobacteria bacterium]|nr:efflux RND transporter periplasmic adaptor subunit [Acidobacteriota bacterium]